MNWFNWLWPKKVEAPKLEKAEPPVISEPVISFVRAAQQNPKRFRLIRQPHRLGRDVPRAILYDVQNGRGFEVMERMTSVAGEFRFVYDWWPSDNHMGWLTDPEIYYINSEFRKIYEPRKARLNELLEIRQNRHKMRERQRYIDIYCKGEID